METGQCTCLLVSCFSIIFSRKVDRDLLICSMGFRGGVALREIFRKDACYICGMLVALLIRDTSHHHHLQFADYKISALDNYKFGGNFSKLAMLTRNDE